MKRSILLMLMFVKVAFLFAQPVTKNDIADAVDKLNNDTKADTNVIVSYRTLDLFFAKKFAYYLSGSNDLSLFNNYAVLDFGDDLAKIGWNINLGKPGTARISNTLTLGLQASVVNSFAALVSDEKLNSNMGVNFGYTHIFKGKVWFDDNVQVQRLIAGPPIERKPQKLLMNQKRMIIAAKLKVELDTQWEEYENYIQALKREYGTATAFIADEETARTAAIKRAILARYYESELEQLEDQDNNAYKRSFIQWVSINGFIPVTKTIFSGTGNLSQAPIDLVTKKWNVDASYSLLSEYRKNKLFANIGLGIFENNSAEAGIMEELSLEKYKTISTVADTSTVAKISSDQVYFGNYETFWTPNMKVQLVFYPKWSPKIGIDLSLLKKMGKDQALDFTLGFPIVVTGQDDSPINFILQLKMPDINNKNDPDKKIREKMQFGFTAGLPFNSILK